MPPVYPPPARVCAGTVYGPTGADYEGTLRVPEEGQVLLGVKFGAAGAEWTGRLFCSGEVRVLVDGDSQTNCPSGYPLKSYGILIRSSTKQWQVSLKSPMSAWPIDAIDWSWRMRLVPGQFKRELAADLEAVSRSLASDVIENDTLVLVFEITGEESEKLSEASHLVDICSLEATAVSGEYVTRFYPSAYGRLEVRSMAGAVS